MKFNKVIKMRTADIKIDVKQEKKNQIKEPVVTSHKYVLKIWNMM